MAGSKGYYSLIQYCPDRSRLEVANVGVMLFCPELHFLGTRMVKGSDRVRRIFRVSHETAARVEEAKRAIGERLEVESRNLPSLEDVAQFISTRGNDMMLTQLRPMKVIRPEADLDSLFKELVGGRERSPRKAGESGIPELDRAFQLEGIRQKITRDLHIQLPLTERQIFIPYAYRNGTLNLIKPQRFSSEKKQIFDRASTLAFEGSLLYRHHDPGIERRLTVVSSFDEPSPSLVSTVEELFCDYNVRHIPLQRIGELVAEIERVTHA